jgi:arginine-tRNA-protein transferase
MGLSSLRRSLRASGSNSICQAKLTLHVFKRNCFAIFAGAGFGQEVVFQVVDVLEDGLSMVYSFYDIDQTSRSLGTMMILDHFIRARKMGLPYVYLGYWVNGAARMQYKTRYRPLERLGPNGWECFDPEADAV